MVYEIAQTQVAEQGLPHKAIGRWFPYVATLMLFIFVVNFLGFIPLPLTGETWHGVPTWGIYAATSSISVTLALALLTFVFTHFEGIQWNGPVRYFKSWIPEAPKPLLALIVPLEILGQFMRLISLSVRLFANMLAGHILILTFIGLIFILESSSWRSSSFRSAIDLLPLRGRDRDRRSRPSSSLPCPPSTSARRSSRSTKEETAMLGYILAARPRATSRRPARRSASRSASASAHSAPASASATSSAR